MRVNYVSTVFSLFLLWVGSLRVYGQQERPVLRIGLIADIQYADKDTHGTRFYREALEKLRVGIAQLHTMPIDFTVVLGDFVDEGPKDLVAVSTVLDQSTAPVYKLLGNHDYDPIGHPDPYSLYQTYQMPASYYRVDTAGWRFIFLNTNELSLYATTPGTWQAAEYQRLVKRLKKEGRTNLKPWNGGVGKRQLKWLATQLREAKQRGYKVLVFTHHPLMPENNGHEALNNREILHLLVAYKKQVKAVFSGHNHAGAFAVQEGLPCITLEGMIETADQNAYGRLVIYSDRIEVLGIGRMTSRVISFENPLSTDR